MLRVFLLLVLFAEVTGEIGEMISIGVHQLSKKKIDVPLARKERDQPDSGSANSLAVPLVSMIPVHIAPVSKTAQNTNIQHTDNTSKDTRPQDNLFRLRVQSTSFLTGFSSFALPGISLGIGVCEIALCAEDGQG